MIVGCERCSTQFQLEDARVPPEGVRVRCSRCKHAFVVHRPGAPDEEAVHAVAARVAESGGVPDVAEDTEAAARVATAAASAATGPNLDEDEEAVWEFNEDFGELSEEGGEAPFPEPDAAGSGLELAREASMDLGSDPAPEEPFAVDDLPDSGDPPAPASAARERDDPPHGLAADDRGDAKRGPELGSPEEWDLLAGSEGAGVEAAPAPQPAWQPRRREPVVEDALAGIDPAALRLRQAGAVAGWLATAVLCAVGLYQGLSPRPETAPEPLQLAGGLELRGVEARWIDHLSEGPVLAVRAALVNTGSEARAVPPLQLVWRDEQGQPVGRPVPLATPRSDVALRELPIGSSEERARALAGAELPVGAMRPLEGLAAGLPYEARRFEIRVRR